jgi:hypothetical protein
VRGGSVNEVHGREARLGRGAVNQAHGRGTPDSISG